MPGLKVLSERGVSVHIRLEIQTNLALTTHKVVSAQSLVEPQNYCNLDNSEELPKMILKLCLMSRTNI